MDSTQNFSGLAKDYTIGRPAYANALIEHLYSRYGFSDQSIIADIGLGTGKFAKQLLDKGSFVYGVEPNTDMRNIAIEELRNYEKFSAVSGNASETGLEEQSVDFITTAQAFHWFDVLSFKKECKRILRENGKVFLIWNIRDMSHEVNQDSFKIFTKYCPNFKGFGGGIQKDDERIKQFFDEKYEYLEFDNPLTYNREKYISRSLSGSYSLKKDDVNYFEYMKALSELYEKYQRDNVLMLKNKTVVYIGQLK